jgi:glyoxylase-like metal-dependent hydrolase (beta-lactamase superfamily II)
VASVVMLLGLSWQEARIGGMRTHGELCVEAFVEPTFGENAYLLWASGGLDAWVVDPGLPPHAQQIGRALRTRELTLRALLLTHCHADHIAGVDDLQREFPLAECWAPRGEERMLVDATANLSQPFGFSVEAPPASRLLAPGHRLELGALQWAVLDVAGHSPAGLAFYCASAGVVLTGDALFAGSIGRYDFPGSSGPRLLQNIRAQLLGLPDQTVVYSGHGPPTTIGIERETNPYLDEDAL